MRKKWLALALSLTMVAGCLTGCGGSDSTTSNTTSGSGSSDSAKVETLADGGGKVDGSHRAGQGGFADVCRGIYAMQAAPRTADFALSARESA